MRAPWLPRRLRDSRDRGTSLVEMMVVIAMLTLVVAATADTMVNGLRVTGGSDLRTVQTQQLRQALDRMTKLLRSAINLPNNPSPLDGFVTSGAREVLFYANYDNAVTSPSPGATSGTTAPLLVQYALVPGTGNLVENIWQPTSTSLPYTYPPLWSLPWSSHVVATGLAVSPSRPIFSYFSADDTGTSSLTTGDAVQLALGEPQGDGGSCTGPCVAAVGITLTTAAAAHGVPPAVAQTEVALPNAAANQSVGVPGAPPVTISPTGSSSPTPPPTTPPPATTSPTATPSVSQPPQPE